MGDQAVRDFHSQFKVVRGIKPIKHYAQSQGVRVSEKAIGQALNSIKAMPNPNAQDARLQNDIRAHNNYRFQRLNRHSEVKANDLIPYASNSDFHWVADLINMSAQPQQGQVGWLIGGANSPHYIFVMINIASRRVFAQPIRRTDFNSVGPAFTKMLADIRAENMDIEKLTTDAGSEFISNQFEHLLAQQNIRHILPAGAGRENPFAGFSRKPSGAGDKTFSSIVERVNQSLRTILSRIRTERNNLNLRWWEHVARAVTIYNNTLHKSLGDTPKEVSENPQLLNEISTRENNAKKQQIQNLTQRGMLDFKIGEAVRPKRQIGPRTFAGKSEGVITPQLRFIIAGRRGTRFLLLPANAGAGRVDALVPPRLYSVQNGRAPLWLPHHAIERLPAYEQPVKTLVPPQQPQPQPQPAPPQQPIPALPPQPAPQQNAGQQNMGQQNAGQRRALRRQMRNMNIQAQQQRVQPMARAYRQLHPQARTEEIEREIDIMNEELTTGRREYNTRKRARENEPPARNTRSRKK